MSASTPRVFTIEPGAPFLDTFAEALLAGAVLPGVSRDSGPLELARTKIYVPTRRAGRALATALARWADRPALLLPTILPLGALDGGETFVGALDNPLAPELARAAGDIERRMILAELILAWARSLRRAIVSIDADGAISHAAETLLVAAHPADAWRLSGEMAELIDEMIIENVEWRGLDALGGEFDDYWRITVRFLDIAVQAWPEIQAARGFVDPAGRQQALIARAIAKVASDPGPVIALGSTGSNIVTARLLAAIARASQGAVVLPGLDQRLDDASFALIFGGGQEAEPCATHPQAFLARLIDLIGVKRSDVRALGRPAAALETRASFASEAFRPADSTDLWPLWRQSHQGQLPEALDGVSLIEASDEREEALAIAIRLRQVLQQPEQTAALVTPDRTLAERVRAELLRWNVEIDDSGGSPLAASRAGSLARLILLALTGGATDWAALLAHPDLDLGLGGDCARQAALFEVGVLRAGVFDGDEGLLALVAPARAAAQDWRAHPLQQAISAEEWAALENFGAKLDAAFAPLRTLSQAGESALTPWLAAHRATLGLLVAGEADAAPGGEDGEALAELFDELQLAANATFTFHAESYAAFFDALIGERSFRGAGRAHPRLKILGLLEARLITADCLVLAGLDEAVWPPQGQTDSFLNRPMRAALGLSSPDRRIGQTAHDFIQAFGAPQVVLSRAKKRGGSPTVPSRFLQRMEALAGNEAFAPLRERGQYWLDLARKIDLSPPQKPLQRPAPCPPLELRPKKLSVTRIEMLRRDPYAIYAETILKLKPLPSLDASLGPREIGEGLHEALEDFVRKFPSGDLPPNARATIIAGTRKKLAAFVDDAEFQAFRWPRLLKGIDAFLAFEAQRRPLIKKILVEESGSLPITLDDGSIFTLTAKADRIELLKDGGAAVVDYKTGTPPSNAQVRAGFAPQLTLEAAMIEGGGFKNVAARKVEKAFYLPLGGGKDKAQDLDDKKALFADLVADHFSELENLLDHFRKPTSTYPARPFPQFAARYNDYDHLARTREWSAAGGENGGDES